MAELKLYWDSVQNAVSYNIYYSTSPGVSISTGLPIFDIVDVVFHHDGLLPSTRYHYIVVAVDKNGTLSPPSVEFSALTAS
jgi:hypothetical protein